MEQRPFGRKYIRGSRSLSVIQLESESYRQLFLTEGFLHVYVGAYQWGFWPWFAAGYHQLACRWVLNMNDKYRSNFYNLWLKFKNETSFNNAKARPNLSLQDW